jgi:hypothetical protein
MRCPSCNAENQGNRKIFAWSAGLPLQTLCVKCSFKNPSTAKFCQNAVPRLSLGRRLSYSYPDDCQRVDGVGR